MFFEKILKYFLPLPTLISISLRFKLDVIFRLLLGTPGTALQAISDHNSIHITYLSLPVIFSSNCCLSWQCRVMCMNRSILLMLVSRALPNLSRLSPCVLLSSLYRITSSVYSWFKVRKGNLWFYLEFLLPQFLAVCVLAPNDITWTQYIAHGKCSPLIRSFLQRFERDCCWRIFLSTLQTLLNLQFWNLSSQYTGQILHSTAAQSINREVRAKTYLKKISS